MNYYLSQFGQSNPEIADTYQHRYRNCFPTRSVIKIGCWANFSSANTGAVTRSWSKANVCMVICQGGYMQQWKLMGSTGFKFCVGDALDTMLSRRDAIRLRYYGFSEVSLIWLLVVPEVPCSISNCPGMITSVSISSPNVVSIGMAAVVSVWSLTTAGTIDLVILYHISLSWK